MSLLNLDQPSVSRLGLEPIKTQDGKLLYGGIVPTIVTAVEVDTQKHEKGEFAGLEVPVLKVEFENKKISGDEPDKFLTHTFKVVGSKQLINGTQDQYEDRPAKDIKADIDLLWGSVKHFLMEGFAGSANFRAITKISDKDFAENFDLPEYGSPEERIAKFTKFFTFIAKFVNGDGNELKSMILTADGKPYEMWVKLLPNYDKDPKRDAKYYTIPRFIGQGVFEPLKTDGKVILQPRILRVKPSENLELKKAVANPNAGAPGAPASGAVSNAGETIYSPDVMNLLKQ